VSREHEFTRTHLEDLDEGHNIADEILDLVNVVVGLKHPGRKATVKFRLNSVGEVLQGSDRSKPIDSPP